MEKLIYNIGYIFGKFITFILKLFFIGVVEAPQRHKACLITHLLFLFANIILFFIFRDASIISIVFIWILVTIFFGIMIRIEDYPFEKRQKYFCKIFEKIGLKNAQNQVPLFVHEKTMSEYASKICFLNDIPISKWQTKKEELELQINTKIFDIRTNSVNIQVIDIFLQKKPLPTKFDWNDQYIDYQNDVLNIGISPYGIVGMDLQKHPHTFVAGETGSGKSNILKCLIYQALQKKYDVVLIDFKRGVSFAQFKDKMKIYYDYPDALNVINSMVKQTIKRLDVFREYNVDNIKDYNKIANNNLKRIIVFIDELAELLKGRDKETSNGLYDGVESLTRLSRAVGIHLVMGIQRPDSTIVNGQIKNNVSFRVCGRFVDREPSRIMLGSDLASMIPNIKGRFIVKNDELYNVQSFCYQTDNYVDNNLVKDIERIDNLSELSTSSKELEFDFSDI